MSHFYLSFTIAGACVRTEPSHEATDTDTSTVADDTITGQDTSEGTDSEDSKQPSGLQCPEEMVAVGEADYCIDRYEAVVVDGLAASMADTIPIFGITFDMAVELCSATPVYGHEGLYGYKRLATSQEWEDAADGIVGEGGTTYPYGNTWIEGACATPSADGTATILEVQKTGSFPQCLSVFGTYDQVGNLWEWADSGLFVDSQKAVEEFAVLGVTLSREEETSIVMVDGDLNRLRIEVAGALSELETDSDGRLYLRDIQTYISTGGYLVADGGVPEFFYPVTLVEGEDAWWVIYHADLDGQPIPDKRGCAYYTGNEYACGNDVASYVHTHDFDGTIGFRCVADPYGK